MQIYLINNFSLNESVKRIIPRLHLFFLLQHFLFFYAMNSKFPFYNRLYQSTLSPLLSHLITSFCPDYRLRIRNTILDLQKKNAWIKFNYLPFLFFPVSTLFTKYHANLKIKYTCLQFRTQNRYFFQSNFTLYSNRTFLPNELYLLENFPKNIWSFPPSLQKYTVFPILNFKQLIFWDFYGTYFFTIDNF